jgi:hypothetical protein
MSRISIKFDNKEVLGADLNCPRPENDHQLASILEEIVRALQSPSVPCNIDGPDDATEELKLRSCEQCGEEAWDGYICHNCGLKKI